MLGGRGGGLPQRPDFENVEEDGGEREKWTRLSHFKKKIFQMFVL